jgi:protein-disulfide isomerase
MRISYRFFIAVVSSVAVFTLGFSDFAQAQTVENDVLSRESVLRDPNVPITGNPDAEFTIVEYFDYQCPYCKQVHPVLLGVVKEDGKIRLVLKDWPIFGDVSRYAARMALAAKFQGKYAEAHGALMSTRSRLSDEAIRKLLSGAGIDMAAASADLQTHQQEIDAILEKNDAQARAFDFLGTPAFIIGKFRVTSVLSAADFKRAIKDARAALAVE